MYARIRRRAFGAALVATPLIAVAALLAQPERDMPRERQMEPDHIMLTPKELQWQPGPDSLPPGAQIAVLEGNPTSSGPFTFRLRVPAGYQIPAHYHPQIEHVTVISGSFYMGTGDRLDTSRGKALTPGSFAVMQIGTRHYAWTDQEAIVQIHGIGPWGITYVDPTTDPRNRR